MVLFCRSVGDDAVPFFLGGGGAFTGFCYRVFARLRAAKVTPVGFIFVRNIFFVCHFIAPQPRAERRRRSKKKNEGDRP